MATRKSTKKRSASTRRGSAKGGRILAGKSLVGKLRATTKKRKSGAPARRHVASVAPVVYQTLREQVDAVNTNVGATENLKDFLASTEW